MLRDKWLHADTVPLEGCAITTSFLFSAPAQLVKRPNQTTSLDAGNAVTFTCVANGDPNPSISWMKGDTLLSNDTRVTIFAGQLTEDGVIFVQSILLLRSAEEADTGLYSCFADNTYGNDTASFVLTVVIALGKFTRSVVLLLLPKLCQSHGCCTIQLCACVCMCVHVCMTSGCLCVCAWRVCIFTCAYDFCMFSSSLCVQCAMCIDFCVRLWLYIHDVCMCECVHVLCVCLYVYASGYTPSLPPNGYRIS